MLEFRFAELRAEGRVLTGTAVRYGDIARIPGIGPETFRPGSIVFSDVVLNRQHDRRLALARARGGGLTLTDSREALQVRAELPPTRESDDTLTLVRRGVLRGLSTEFTALREHRENGVRVITRAKVSGVAVVDRPAYGDSLVQARKRGTFASGGVGLSGRVPKGRKLACQCHRGTCEEIEFEVDAFEKTIRDVYENGVRDILAVAGDYKRGLASAKRGTLALDDTADGLQVQIAKEALNTPVGRELVEMSENVPIYARPIFDQDTSKFVEGADGVARYSEARLKAILVGPTDNNAGWPEVKIGGTVERMEPMCTTTARRASGPLDCADDDVRFRVWL